MEFLKSDHYEASYAPTKPILFFGDFWLPFWSDDLALKNRNGLQTQTECHGNFVTS